MKGQIFIQVLGDGVDSFYHDSTKSMAVLRVKLDFPEAQRDLGTESLVSRE